LELVPKISIVVVNKNGAKFLKECLRSIVDQEYPNLELIVVDGGSSDGSMDIINHFLPHIEHLFHEPDEGPYFAVDKGLKMATGDVMAWINSDDKYLPGAFHTTANILSVFPEVEWLMGYPGEYDIHGTLIKRIAPSWARWSRYRYLSFDYQFIQQESCFWRRELWEKAGNKIDTSFQLAADLELWTRFFRHARLHTTIASLAGFRQHSKNQRSVAQRSEYMAECRQIIQRELSQQKSTDRLWYQLLRPIGWVLGPLFFFELPFVRHIYRWFYRIPMLINYDVVNHCYHRSERLVKFPSQHWRGKSIHRESLNKTTS